MIDDGAKVADIEKWKLYGLDKDENEGGQWRGKQQECTFIGAEKRE